MYAEFDESLVTGNEMIDGQHRELIAKINKLVDCCEQSSGKLEAIKMLDYLSEYTDFHFSAEEKLQEEISYPGLEEHKKQHAAFVKAVGELHEMLEEEEGPTDAFVEQPLAPQFNILFMQGKQVVFADVLNEEIEVGSQVRFEYRLPFVLPEFDRIIVRTM